MTPNPTGHPDSIRQNHLEQDGKLIKTNHSAQRSVEEGKIKKLISIKNDGKSALLPSKLVQSNTAI